jgi:hypothetical protein
MQRIKQKIKHVLDRVLFWIIVYTIEIIVISPIIYIFYKMIEYKLINYWYLKFGGIKNDKYKRI